ncbi:MAG TPA: hypothetical protein VFS59_09730 [Gemmatimonadaceae bacterium]|nr:hypothetical protein [Gemmatimonadaceae bacterium]
MNRIAQYLIDTPPPPPVVHRWQTVVPAELPASFAPIPVQLLAGLDDASRLQLVTLYARARAAAEAELRRAAIEALLASL